MSSRFFAGGSDSESSSSEDEELYSDQEESQEESSEPESDEDEQDSDDSSDEEGQGADRFLKGADSDEDSDEDDGAKVLKSAKDKRFEELESTISSIENKEKINDWAAVSERECIARAAHVVRWQLPY